MTDVFAAELAVFVVAEVEAGVAVDVADEAVASVASERCHQ